MCSILEKLAMRLKTRLLNIIFNNVMYSLIKLLNIIFNIFLYSLIKWLNIIFNIALHSIYLRTFTKFSSVGKICEQLRCTWACHPQYVVL